MSVEEVESAVLALPFEERARMADRLVESLTRDPREERDQAWENVALRRIDAVRSGKVEPVKGEDGTSFLRSLIQ